MENDRYRLLLENLTDGFAYHKIITDSDGKPVDYIFLEVNQAFENMTGLTKDRIIGKKVTQVLPGIEHAESDWIGNFGKVALTGESMKVEQYFNPLKRWFEVNAYSDKRNYFAAVFHDVTGTTKRKQTEKESLACYNEPTTLYNFSAQMRAAASYSELLPIVLAETLGLIQTDTGMIILLTADGESCEISVASGHWEAVGGRVFPLEQETFTRLFSSAKPYITNDYSSEAVALPLDNVNTTGPAAFVPLQSEETMLGMLVVARSTASKAGPFTRAEVKLLNAIGEMAGNALHRQKLHENARERMEQLQAMRKIDTAITGNLDLESTLQITLSQVTAMLHVDGAAILRLNRDKTMQYSSWQGFHRVDPGQIKLHRGIPGMDRLVHLASRDQGVLEQHSVFIPDLLKAGDGMNRHLLMEKEGFIAYGAVPLVARNQVLGILEVFNRKPLHPGSDWLEFLETLAGQAAIAIDNDRLFTGLEHANMELTLAYDATIEGWAYALDLRDEETEGHSQRVTEMTVMLALAMGMPKEQLLHIRRGALLHDIGKMGIPDRILLKPGKLTDEEWEIMRMHPTYAFEMLSSIDYLRPALSIPHCHHERWDGGGYPKGLRGESIPLEARIFSVVDVYDALTSDRPYRSAWSREKALAHIYNEQGKQFDPRVAELFLKELG